MKEVFSKLAFGLAVLGSASAAVSQAPEAFGCYDANGDRATEMVGGDLRVPSCDSENMSPLGNAIHGSGKVVAVIALAGGGVAFGASKVGRD